MNMAINGKAIKGIIQPAANPTARQAAIAFSKSAVVDEPEAADIFTPPTQLPQRNPTGH